ncbi:hypothetical protein HID58_067241 [Brassica napus]|uniref:Uncharacterized protein n=1 Tax=Brassica napus TaxID=3708 RepID=A0ABQ7ZID5_BRANA|nr:hypothetical protein HID58_067241 [Brassica napus]
MNLCYHIHSSVLKLPHFFTPKLYGVSSARIESVHSGNNHIRGEAGGVTAAGMYAGFRASGKKPNLALVTCDVGAVAAGVFTMNVVAAPVVYCKKVLGSSEALESVDKALVSRLVVRVCVAAGAMEKRLCLDNILGSVVV